ncbi:MAG: alkaline phosphatase [Ignavibacteriales bacterium]
MIFASMRRKKLAAAVVLSLLISAWSIPTVSAADTPFETQGPKQIKHIILVIGDGMGKPQRQAAQEYLKYAKKSFVMDALPVQGTVKTTSLSGVTDTIAADTALLTGYKTINGLPFTAPDGTRYPSVLELAKQKGWSTGVLTTSFVDGLTALKSKDQGKALLIAQLAVGAVDMLVTNTSMKQVALAKSQLVLLSKQMGYVVSVKPSDPATLHSAATNLPQRTLGLQYNEKPYEIDRSAEYGLLTSQAADAMLQTLDLDPEGFMLIVHGAQIDKAAHSGDLAAETCEVLALDKTVAVCQRYYNNHPQDTVLIVTGDHETGKLSLNAQKTSKRGSLLYKLKASIDKMAAYYVSIAGDPLGYVAYLKKVGLGTLTRAEINKLGLTNSSRGSQTTVKKPTTSVRSIINNRAGAVYGSTWHSDQPVPVSAIGPGTEKLSGSIDNTDIGKFLISIAKGPDKINTPTPAQ